MVLVPNVVSTTSGGKDDYIPESLFYRLGMKASNARAEKFQNWLAMEVIPSIRKNGGYPFNLHRKEGGTMVTYEQLFLFCTFLVALISLCYQIFKGKK